MTLKVGRSAGFAARQYICACAVACALAAQDAGPASTSASKQPPQGDPAEQIAPSLRRFVEVLSTVQAEAPDQVPLDKLIYEGAIPSMLL